MNKFTKEDLKVLIRECITEMMGRTGDNVYNYPVELDIVLPGLTTEQNTIELMVRIYYDYERGESARGMFGPPEHSSPGYGSQVDIVDWEPNKIWIHPEGKEIDIKALSPEQRKIVDDNLKVYMQNHEDDIANRILEDIQQYSEPDYDDNDD